MNILASETEQELNAQAAWPSHSVLGDAWVEGLFWRAFGNSIWFPLFNQVTQAWNAQLCQTEHSGCLRNNRPSGLLMQSEATVSFLLCAERQP